MSRGARPDPEGGLVRDEGSGSAGRRVQKAALAYFASVFVVGFLLGTVRVLLVVPAVGERTAELLEMPVMVLVSLLAARWVVRRFAVSGRPRARMAVGSLALLLLLGAELLVVLLVQRTTVGDSLAGRDPVAGTAYAASLLLFGLMPWLVAAWERRRRLDGA